MITYRQPFRGEYPITQQFGEVIEGVTFGDKPHTGIDYGCPMGTEILASADGVVMASSYDGSGYGLRVIIRHETRKSTMYAHLSKSLVKPGQEISQGAAIGLSGNTGYTTGPHLHFEAREIWWDQSTAKDPVSYLPLMSFADAAPSEPETVKDRPLLEAGAYRIACNAAYIRTWPGLERDRMLSKGERVYIFDDVLRNESRLPFRFIGAGRCIAEYDIDGTIILEKDNGKKE